MSKQRLSRKYKDLVLSLTDEFLEPRADGLRVAAEFSTSRNKVSRKKSFFRLQDRRLPEGYRWVMFECRVCVGHCADTPIHCAILSDEEIDEIGVQFL